MTTHFFQKHTSKVLGAILSFYLLSIGSVYCQETKKAITQDGQTIIINSNGTWTYENGTSPAPQVVTTDCQTYSIGDLKVTNNTGYPLVGRVWFNAWHDGNGKGGTYLEKKQITLQLGQTMFFGDVYKGEVGWDFFLQIPDPKNIGALMIGNEIRGNDYVETCKVKEISIR